MISPNTLDGTPAPIPEFDERAVEVLKTVALTAGAVILAYVAHKAGVLPTTGPNP